MVGFIGVLYLDLLERYLAVQLFVIGDENLAQSAARVRSQNAESASL